MTKQQRELRWIAIPTFVKQALVLFVLGNVFEGLLPLIGMHRTGYVLPQSLMGICFIVIGEGVRRTRPPLPRVGQGLATPGSQDYEKLWKLTIVSTYVSGALCVALAAVGFLKR